MEYLEGGREGQISRHGTVVRRPAGRWSPSVHALLRHLSAAGFDGAPRALGIDDDGFERVSFIPGEVSNYPLSPAAASEQALISAAQLLRRYHEVSRPFVSQAQNSSGESATRWMLEPQQPAEVICHGDFAPYNVVLQGCKAHAMIDFDTAHPGPALWDVAYAVYRWVPLVSPASPDNRLSVEQQLQRARLFCDSYGLTETQRRELVDTLIARLNALVAFMHAQARQGNAAFQANISDGHDQAYLKDIAWLRENRTTISQQLLR